MPTRIFPGSILPEELLVTHQRSHTRRLTQIVTQFRVAAVEQMLFRFAQRRYRNYSRNAGWSSLVARQAHNLKAAGSNPAPATNFLNLVGLTDSNLPPHIAQARFTLRNQERKIQRSSVVERSAVNRLVVGSNPTAGANFTCRSSMLMCHGWWLTLESHSRSEFSRPESGSSYGC